MTITPKQLADRNAWIGSSDAAAILGLSPWQSAADIQAQKLGLLEPKGEPGELAQIGTALEAGIADLTATRIGCRLVKPRGPYRSLGCLSANVDRQIERAARGASPVEIKDSGIDEDWGQPGTAEIPAYVLAQVTHQLICTEAKDAIVARLGRGWNRGLYLYTIRTDDPGVAALIEAMTRYLPMWHQRHIVNRDPLPAGSPPPTMETLRRLRRIPASTTNVPNDLFLAAFEARKAKRAAIEASDIADRRLLAALGPAEQGVCAHGICTNFESERAAHHVARARYRSLRFK